jgi:hypothetical protein
MAEPRLHLTPTGRWFPAPDHQVAEWMRPALLWLTAHRGEDTDLHRIGDVAALHEAAALDVACGALAIAGRLLQELDDPEAYLGDLGLRIAEALAVPDEEATT